MAKEILVRNHLTEEMEDSGQALLQRLDAQGLSVSSFYWFFDRESDSWKLCLVSPAHEELGPRELYAQILRANSSLGERESVISLHDIAVVHPKDRIAVALHRMIDTGDKTVAGIRASRNYVDGMYVDDCLIYRSSPPATPGLAPS